MAMRMMVTSQDGTVHTVRDEPGLTKTTCGRAAWDITRWEHPSENDADAIAAEVRCKRCWRWRW